MNSPIHTRFYRDKVNGKISGVCAGLADYTGIDVLWIRLGALLLSLHGIGLLVYALIAWLAPKKPPELYASRDEQRFWQGVRQSPQRTSREVRALIAGDGAALAAEAAELFGARALLGAGTAPLSLTCATASAPRVADWLIAKGAEHVTVGQLAYVFSAKNALYEKLASRVG